MKLLKQIKWFPAFAIRQTFYTIPLDHANINFQLHFVLYSSEHILN